MPSGLWCEIDAHDRPELFQGLPFLWSGGLSRRTKLRILRMNLLPVKHILGHRHSKLLVIASL